MAAGYSVEEAGEMVREAPAEAGRVVSEPCPGLSAQIGNAPAAIKIWPLRREPMPWYLVPEEGE